VKQAQLSDAYRRYIASAAWRAKRARHAKRQTCEACGFRGQVDVHHKTYSAFRRERTWDLIALCRDCHEEVHRRQRATGRNLWHVTDDVGAERYGSWRPPTGQPAPKQAPAPNYAKRARKAAHAERVPAVPGPFDVFSRQALRSRVDTTPPVLKTRRSARQQVARTPTR